MKKRTLLTSILTIVMCLSLTVGATFALFTSKSEVNIAVTSGSVNVKATASDLDTDIYVGSATLVGNEITIERMLPGDSFSFDIAIENYSDVAVKYRTVISNTDGGLFKALKVTIDDGSNKRTYNGGYVYEDWAELSAGDSDPTTAEDVKTLNVLVEFPETGVAQDEYQGKACTMNVLVEAVQGNATVVNPVTKINDRHYEINDAKGMMLIDSILSGISTGEGVGVKFDLTDNVDMTGYAWTPISTMWVEFNGNGHKISNLNCGYDSWGRSGFFGYLGGGKVENLILENVTAEGSQVGVVAGALEGQVENVTIIGNNGVKYNREINVNESWGGAGAVAGVAQLVPASVVIEGNVSVNYNGLITNAPLKNNLAQIKDISTGVTVSGNVTTIGEAIYGFYVENDADLKIAIDKINIDNAFWNTPVIVVMKAGEYIGNYHLKQFPLTDGSTIISETATADKTFVTFLGEDGVVFKGHFVITGNGNGRGGAENYNPETNFIKIAFDAKDVVLAGSTDRYNTNLLKGADNVNFKNCLFTNSTHVKVGGTGIDGSGDITLTNCNFKNSGVITGGFGTIVIKDGEFDDSENGFLNAQRGRAGDNNGKFYVDGITVKNCKGYAIRSMNTDAYGGDFEVTNSSFEILYSEEDNMATLACFRGPSTATFTNCEIEAETYVEYLNKATANNTTLTVNGKVVGSLIEEGNTYHVYDINGLLKVNEIIKNYNESGKGELQLLTNKTISIENDINAHGKVWECRTIQDLHGATHGFIFDGNGYTISNLVISGPAMFRNHASNGVADPTIFKNLTFDNVTVDSNDHHTAVIWAEMYGEIEINNVKIINSSITGKCNVAAFVGRNGAAHAGSEIKFVNCSVENTTITATTVADYCGASYFLGTALKGGNTTLKLTFEGNNSYNNVTLTSATGLIGGGVYAKADYTDINAAAWTNPTVVNDFTNYTVNP